MASSASEPQSCAMQGTAGGLCDRCKILEEAGLLEPIKAKQNVAADVQVDQLGNGSLDPSFSEYHDPIIGRAPLEISSYIFELYIQAHEWKRPCDDIYKGVHPSVFLRLGAVCRSWRRIAWSFPRLWTTLWVDISSKGCRYASELAMEWIKRTGNLPLTISLYDSNTEYDGFVAYICAECVHHNALSVIEVINLFSFRWETLTLWIPFKYLPHIDNGDSVDGPSTLRQLHLSGMCEGDDADRCSSALFQSSSRRHSPTLVTLSFFAALNALEINWTNVTDFYAGPITHMDICEVFQNAPCLTTCSIDAQLIADLPLVTEVTVAQSLLSLSIRESLDPSTGDLLDRLCLPSLEEFSYCGFNAYWETPIENLTSLIQRSDCQLQHLKLDNAVLLDNMLIRALQVMPTLKILKLRLRQENNAEELLVHLGKTVPKGTGPLLLPDLEYLDIEAPRTFSWTTLANIFGSDLTLNASYPSQRHDLKVDIEVGKAVLGHSSEYIDQESLVRCIQLRRSGVDISIYTYAKGMYQNLIKDSFMFHFPPELLPFAVHHDDEDLTYLLDDE